METQDPPDQIHNVFEVGGGGQFKYFFKYVESVKSSRVSWVESHCVHGKMRA